MSNQMMNNDISIHVNALNTEWNAAIHPVVNEEEEEDKYVIQKLAAWAFCAYNISILIVEISNTPSISFSHFAKKIIAYNPSYMQLQVICIVALLCLCALFGTLHLAIRIQEKYADIISKKNAEIQMLKDQVHKLTNTSPVPPFNKATPSKPVTPIGKKMD